MLMATANGYQAQLAPKVPQVQQDYKDKQELQDYKGKQEPLAPLECKALLA
jgi:hypothetical protein